MTSRTGAPRPRSGGAPSAPTTFTRAMQRVFGLFRARAGAHFPREPGQRPEFESLEPRLLLSADLLAPGVAALLAPSERQDGALIGAPTHVAAGEPPAIRFAVTDHATPASGFAGQTIYLDLDGAQEVSYRGPVTVEGIDIPTFRAPDALAGQEQAIAEFLVETLQQAVRWHWAADHQRATRRGRDVQHCIYRRRRRRILAVRRLLGFIGAGRPRQPGPRRHRLRLQRRHPARREQRGGLRDRARRIRRARGGPPARVRARAHGPPRRRRATSSPKSPSSPTPTSRSRRTCATT